MAAQKVTVYPGLIEEIVKDGFYALGNGDGFVTRKACIYSGPLGQVQIIVTKDPAAFLPEPDRNTAIIVS